MENYHTQHHNTHSLSVEQQNNHTDCFNVYVKIFDILRNTNDKPISYLRDYYPQDYEFLLCNFQDLAKLLITSLSYNESASHIIKELENIKPLDENNTLLLAIYNPAAFMNSKSHVSIKLDSTFLRRILNNININTWIDFWPDLDTECMDIFMEMYYSIDFSVMMTLMESMAGNYTMPLHAVLYVIGIPQYADRFIKLLEKGYYTDYLEDLDLLRRLLDATSIGSLVNLGIFEDFKPEILRLLDAYEARCLVEYIFKAGRIFSESEMEILINTHDSRVFVGITSLLSPEQQNLLFNVLVNYFPNRWFKMNLPFNNLSEESYTKIIAYIEADATIYTVGPDYIDSIFEYTTESIKQDLDTVLNSILSENHKYIRNVSKLNRQRLARSVAEESYLKFNNYILNPEDHNTPLTDSQIISLFETDHCVKRLPNIDEMAEDIGRTNEITCAISSMELATSQLGAEALIQQDICTVTEQEAIREYIKWLDSPRVDYSRTSLRKELSFIGLKEYQEATRGIGVYWKSYLDQDTANTIIVNSVISKANGMVKSDRYLIDNILSYFSDNEMLKYAGKLIIGGNPPESIDPSKVKYILVDDWTISGSQLKNAYNDLGHKYPNMVSSIEVHLVVASEPRIALGMEDARYYGSENGISSITHSNLPLIVKAYYLAHNSSNSRHRGSVISGFHSSVDYNFTEKLHNIKARDNEPLPLLASVVRPYRLKEYETTNIDRWRRLNGTISVR